MNTREIIELIEQESVSNEVLTDLIEQYAEARERMIDRYERYKATEEGVPVFKRRFEDENKINNKINADFMSEIVDTKTGYFAGVPIAYSLDKEKYEGNEGRYVRHYATLTDFLHTNTAADLDSEATKMAAIAGYCGRLAYIEAGSGIERIMNVEPWEVQVIYDKSIHEPAYAMRYYQLEESKTKRKYWHVEWYDNSFVTEYRQNEKGIFIEVSSEPHLFDYIPLWAILNNEEKQGDCDKVLAAIDAIDRTLSDANSEIEQFRLAYMAMEGVEPDAETMEFAKRTGAFGMPEGAKIYFLTKDMNDGMIENHLNRLEDYILRFAKSVNFGDESFAGNQSGVAMRYKLQALENKCATFERKLTSALMYQFKVIGSSWRKRGIDIEPSDIFYQFKRNFPVSWEAEAEATGKLRGQVSENTRLGLLSFVDDVEYEIDLMEQEMSPYMTDTTDAPETEPGGEE